MIEANPDTEHARLKRPVSHMSINNADDIRERFSKELPRRLFPRSCNLYAQQRCAATLAADSIVKLPKHPPFPPPPSFPPISSIPLLSVQKPEPETYSKHSRADSICSSDDVTNVRRQSLIARAQTLHCSTQIWQNPRQRMFYESGSIWIKCQPAKLATQRRRKTRIYGSFTTPFQP